MRCTPGLLFFPILLFACSESGSSDLVPIEPGGGDFLVLRTTPSNNGSLFLNESIEIDFSHAVDLQTVDLNTIRFQVFDLQGVSLVEQPTGHFELSTSVGDSAVGRRLRFVPNFPGNDHYSDGGFRPGRRYVVSLPGGEKRNGTVVTSSSGRALDMPISFEFRTPSGTAPSELFRDTLPGGPRRLAFEVSPKDASGVGLNHSGLDGVEVRLTFDQPLNPHSLNIPRAVTPDPRTRSDKGRVFLEYSEPGSTQKIWLPATVDVEINSLAGSLVVLRPIGVLPNNSLVRVIVESSLEDMAGESNGTNAAYDRVFAAFETRKSFVPQYDAVVEAFVDGQHSVDLGAAFLEPSAEVQGGRLRSTFAFEGANSTQVYEPINREIILNTDFTQIVPKGSPPVNVSGGVFRFARVHIPAGVSVRGTGTKPMVWLCNGDFIVDGDLSVSGGQGSRVNTLNSAIAVAPGGIGNCGGGSGGRGSPQTTSRSLSGEAGNGSFQKQGAGGEPGRLACSAGCVRGSGGGGGSLATHGDPFYPPNQPAQRANWTQLTGTGEPGCSGAAGSATRSLAGGSSGPVPFVDSRSDNDFWGEGVNLFGQVRIRGELFSPVGGSGGGGGGDQDTSCQVFDPSFINGQKGGGGGAGGGILIIKALGKIVIGRNGHILSEGGHGGGGARAGSNDTGGGGGGGSGGMIVLMAGEGIEIEVHGDESAKRSTYGNGENDFDFAISADGGVCTQGNFNGTPISGKYPVGNSTWANKPVGGFGGLGIVQLMVPPGDDKDGTGNRLDDNISFVVNGVAVSSARKIQLLAWRGWFSEQKGVMVDDLGNPTNIGDNEGDIRPAPVLLPAPFGPTSRARTHWVDLGRAARAGLAAEPSGFGSGVVTTSPVPNPDFGFAATRTTPEELGYADYTASAAATFPSMLATPARIVGTDVTADVDGEPAYVLRFGAGDLGAIENRFVHYRASVLDAAGSTLAEFRILKHDDERMFVAAADGALPSDPVRVQILAKFFEVFTDAQQGLGATATFDPGAGGIPFEYPKANVRFGFAFHTDPAGGGKRFPADTSAFAFDLHDPSLLAFLKVERPTFVQWDVLFNARYLPRVGNRSAEVLSPEMTRQELDFLVLPYRW